MTDLAPTNRRESIWALTVAVFPGGMTMVDADGVTHPHDTLKFEILNVSFDVFLMVKA